MIELLVEICVKCEGTGQMCEVCRNSMDSCECDDPELGDCEICDGAGSIATDDEDEAFDAVLERAVLLGMTPEELAERYRRALIIVVARHRSNKRAAALGQDAVEPL